jgi:hypothetical protein
MDEVLDVADQRCQCHWLSDRPPPRGRITTSELDGLQQPRLKTQDSFVLGSATDKGFNTYFCLLQQQDSKNNPFCKWLFRRKDIQIWAVPLLWHLKWVFHIGTLLEAIGIILKTYFLFGFRNGSPVADSLRASPTVPQYNFPNKMVLG